MRRKLRYIIASGVNFSAKIRTRYLAAVIFLFFINFISFMFHSNYSICLKSYNNFRCFYFFLLYKIIFTPSVKIIPTMNLRK